MRRLDWRTLILIGTVAFFLYLVRNVLPPFVIAAVLAYIFSPLLDQLEQRLRLSRLLAVILFFAMILVTLALAGFLLVPPLIRETVELTKNTPAILTDFIVQLVGAEPFELFGQWVDAPTIADWLLRSIGNALGQPGEAIHLASLAITLLLHLVLSLVLLFYFLLDRERIAAYLVRFVPAERRSIIRLTAHDIHIVLARYVRGLLALVTLMATITWLGLALGFGLRYALPLAIATGFFEIVPLVGPIAAASMAALVGLVQGGPGTAVSIMVFYYVVRQIEDQLLIPVVLGRAVQLHPVSVIFAVLAGGAIAGVLGMVLAVPTAAAVKLIMERWRGDHEAETADSSHSATSNVTSQENKVKTGNSIDGPEVGE